MSDETMKERKLNCPELTQTITTVQPHLVQSDRSDSAHVHIKLKRTAQ